MDDPGSVARNPLQKQRYSGHRRRALADRVATMTTDQDFVAPLMTSSGR